jgi:hypothetical protein
LLREVLEPESKERDVLSLVSESKKIRGIGMSDDQRYARELCRVFSYTNTYYDQEPKLDIRQLPEQLIGCADFVISSDVFEHVSPPVFPAFQQLRKLLKPGAFWSFLFHT